MAEAPPVEETLEDILVAMRRRHAEIVTYFADHAPPGQVLVPSAPPLPPRVSMTPTVREFEQTTYDPPADSLVITSNAEIATAILEKLLSHDDITWTKSARLSARKFGLSPIVYWSDLKNDQAKRSRVESLLSCRELVECGLGLTEFVRLRLAPNYQTLKDVFGFSPKALKVNYRLLNLGLLRQFYGVDYRHFIVDFGFGPADYLVNCCLSLLDIKAFGIETVRDSLMNPGWTQAREQAYRDLGGVPPEQELYQDRRIATLTRALDRELFMERYETWNDTKQTPETLKDWIAFMSLTISDLIDLGLTRQDVAYLWVPSEGTSVDELLLRHFGQKQAHLIERLPDAPLPPPPSSSSDSKKKHRRKRESASPPPPRHRERKEKSPPPRAPSPPLSPQPVVAAPVPSRRVQEPILSIRDTLPPPPMSVPEEPVLFQRRTAAAAALRPGQVQAMPAVPRQDPRSGFWNTAVPSVFDSF